MTPRVMTPRVPPRLVATLGPLLMAAAAAEALAADTEPDDLAQTLWLRLAEDTRAAGPPPTRCAGCGTRCARSSAAPKRRPARVVPVPPRRPTRSSRTPPNSP